MRRLSAVKPRVLVVVGGIVLLLALFAIREYSLRRTPVGVWSDGNTELTFLDDGTAVVDDGRAARPLTWKSLGGNRFILTAAGFMPMSATGCFAANEVKLRSGAQDQIFHPGPRGTPIRVIMPAGAWFTGPTTCDL
ncbi:hypothetical protein [Sphingomonas sp.]|uniref:hypothetical protein n=1 Tax=Sphingomonas sp. TaxID=28214 RepID=UPI001B282F58|nr:hypothetical protein [Sphingomonas sp.]MBO9714251.1 hypothetical protein [Sphingomonas sp.]